MARTHSLASFRPAGFALLKPASKPQLDTARIITLSGTIAVNVLAMGLLMMPMTLPAPLALPDETPPTVYDWIKPKPTPPIPVPVVEPQSTPPTAQPVRQQTVLEQPTAIATPVLTENATEQASESTALDTSTVVDIAPVAIGPAPVQLQYKSAPAPDYPRMAKQRGLTGTVLLQVLVGIDGRPLQVTVAQSSGHRELDEAARAQVMKRWSFEPARKDGQTVQAIGMVPIEFALR